MPLLTEGLKTIAEDTKKFADKALACGVGPHFLTHDLRALVDDLRMNVPKDGCDARLVALDQYLVGLREVIDEDTPDWSLRETRVDEMPDLCNQGLTLALGQSIVGHAGSALAVRNPRYG